MACRPAFTCCMAWLPVSAPSAFTQGLSWIERHRRSAPRRASVYSTCTVPRRRITSSAVYGRATLFQRSLFFQSSVICSAVCVFIVGLRGKRSSGQVFVGGQGEEVAQFACVRECGDQCGRLIRATRARLVTLAKAVAMRGECMVEQREVDRRVVAELEGAVMQPLPELCAGDLRRGRVFHEVVNRHAAEAFEPGRRVAQANFDVVVETLAGDGADGRCDQRIA